MIKGSSGREFLFLWLIEHFGISGILGGELLLDPFSSLGKRGGESDLPYMGVVLLALFEVSPLIFVVNIWQQHSRDCSVGTLLGTIGDTFVPPPLVCCVVGLEF